MNNNTPVKLNNAHCWNSFACKIIHSCRVSAVKPSFKLSRDDARWPPICMRSGAFFRAHWIPDRSAIWMRPGALYRAHWIPVRPAICMRSGALFRAHWTPIVQKAVSDRELFSELAEPPIAEQTLCDRKLFSELFETPIYPMLLNMVPSYVDVVNPTFDLQINGEGIWRWREVFGRPKTPFELLKISVSQLGYRLAESGCERLRQALAQSVGRFRLKIQSISNGKKRKQLKGETWIKVSFHFVLHLWCK